MVIVLYTVDLRTCHIILLVCTVTKRSVIRINLAFQFYLIMLSEFIRKKMPYNLAPKVQDDTIVGFLSGWIDNRIRCLVVEPRNQTRLRYLIAAYAFQQRVAFG